MSVNPESGSNEAWVAVASGPLAGPVLGRVVGMLTARADCPIDRLDDALLVADAVAARAGGFTRDGRVQVSVAVDPGSVALRVGPLQTDGAAGLVASAALPGVGNVLERVADELETATDGDGAGEFLVIRLGFDVQRPPMIGRMDSDAS